MIAAYNETELIDRYSVQCSVSDILKNKRINKILPHILVLVIPDYFILHLSLLLYSYCKNVEREIYTTGPLRAWI